jgi:hypothetical protein
MKQGMNLLELIGIYSREIIYIFSRLGNEEEI